MTELPPTDPPTIDPPPPPSWLPPTPPPPPPPSGQNGRRLRRSTGDRVAAGVCGGLGDYFRVDPVLFRVIFAVTAFFGGAGVIAYLIAWAVIPDSSSVTAPLDRLAAALRRRHVPFWLVATVGVLIVWGLAFSWWAPGPSGAVVVGVVILAIFLSRRSAPLAPIAASSPTESPTELPWLPETRSWMAESRQRRHRAAPVRWATLAVLVAALGGVAIADAVGGIVFGVYFWVLGGVVLTGLLVGLALRRTPWTLALLLIPAVLGLVAFGATKASLLQDGSGRIAVIATSAGDLAPQYKQAFGEITLDLSSIAPLSQDRTVDITLAGGRVLLELPAAANVTVNGHVRAGAIKVDGQEYQDFNDRQQVAATSSTGARLTINVHLGAGQLEVDHR